MASDDASDLFMKFVQENGLAVRAEA